MSDSAQLLESTFQSVLWLSWQGTLLTLVVAVGLLLAGRRISAHWRYLAWALVVLRLLLVWGVASPFSLYNLAIADAPTRLAQGADATDEVVMPTDEVAAVPLDFEPVIQPLDDTITDPVVDTGETLSEPPAVVMTATDGEVWEPLPAVGAAEPVPSGEVQDWTAAVWVLLGVVWAVGACVVAVRLIRLQRQVAQILARGGDAPAELNQQVAHLAQSTGLWRSVRVRVLTENFGPAVSGLWRPTLYLPSWMLDSLSREERELVIRHELSHLERGDIVMMWVMAAVRVVHWFNPCVRWALGRLQQECELACDERVLSGIDSNARSSYARLLLRVVEQATQPPAAPSLLTFSRNARQLKTRLESAGAYHRPKLRTNLVAACAIGLLAVAGLTNGLAEDPQETRKAEVESAGDADAQSESAKTSSNNAEEPTVVFNGVCVDDEGNGLPGIQLRAYGRETPVAKVEILGRFRTDENGKFRIELPREDLVLKPGRYCRVILTATSLRYNSRYQPLTLEESKKRIEMQFTKRGESLRGRIVDERGQPRPGVSVYLPNVIGRPIPGFNSSLTNEEGQFEIPDCDLPVNREPEDVIEPKQKTTFITYSLLTMHPDYPTTAHMVSPDDNDFELVLREGGTFNGRVVDDVTGKPVAGCIVSAQGVKDSGWARTETDAEGRYKLSMPVDRYNIWASLKDRVPVALDSVEAIKGEVQNVPDIRMVEGGFIVGRVVDANTGKPVSQNRLRNRPLQVAHYGPARPRSGAAVLSAPIDQDGKFRLRVAPGENFVYLMSTELEILRSSRNGDISIKDGETVELDYFVKLKAAYLANDFHGNESKVTRLLRELHQLQLNSETGSLPWARKLRELILLGPEAVPELCAALDATPANNRLMLRSIPFILRGIGDKRAIPALIRAIPRCYGNDGSDMGYACDDPELLKFLQQHHHWPRNRDTRGLYRYGRPINEVFGALENWSGLVNDKYQLQYVIDDECTPRQRQLRRQLFQDAAVRWERWWKRHWREHVSRANWSDVRVNLPEFKPEEPAVYQLDRTKPLKRVTGRGGSIAQSVYNVKSHGTFFDLDTGRRAGLPQRWRERSRDELYRLQPEIIAWAKSEGFDLMGTEIQHQGKNHFVLQGIDLEAWEIPQSFWKNGEAVAPQTMIDKGRPVKDLIAHFDDQTGTFAHDETAVFFYITNEGTPGKLYLGVQVQDTNIVRGAPSPKNRELNPIGFRKGRRFGLAVLAKDE